ncbi:MAG: nucleotide exchange factor GrpE [Candidatus Lambdaproteobacteria bacterium RIFOXYD2_FULL_50_16]|uniref:Protein GrpE n=1 Tax=Candidatus Lambdaproteobacteria bacterium RIFOXYD2_FULL_50_16 TaxID=1817772 RepID=A0A1F6GB94_9PROT|nr:MAG: nucleotide exchange factor GrpE [Candidatus Lambdaproteobacteria bacterium RIFOXYD2_FULL_50_16]
MSKPKVTVENTEETSAQEVVESGEEAISTPPQAPPAEPAPAPDPLVLAKARITELEDKVLRISAEFENSKKRLLSETESRLKYANVNLVRGLLPVLDNLERALGHAQEQTAQNEALKNFVAGLDMVKGQLMEAFKSSQVERFSPLGEPFDPNLHEAVGVIDTNEYQPDHVALVLQAGYRVHDRVVRPAMVQVAKKS